MIMTKLSLLVLNVTVIIKVRDLLWLSSTQSWKVDFIDIELLYLKEGLKKHTI